MLRNPAHIFLIGFLAIIMYLTLQLFRPFLSNYNTIDGVLIKYEILNDSKKFRSDYMVLWLKDTPEPFYNQYLGEQKVLLKNLDILLNKRITLWHNDTREVYEVKTENEKLLHYHWFVPLYLFFLAFGLFFHIYTYLEVKSNTTNINSYKDMWLFALGEKWPILKYNNKPFKAMPRTPTKYIMWLFDLDDENDKLDKQKNDI